MRANLAEACLEIHPSAAVRDQGPSSGPERKKHGVGHLCTSKPFSLKSRLTSCIDLIGDVIPTGTVADHAVPWTRYHLGWNGACKSMQEWDLTAGLQIFLIRCEGHPGSPLDPLSYRSRVCSSYMNFCCNKRQVHTASTHPTNSTLTNQPWYLKYLYIIAKRDSQFFCPAMWSVYPECK